jgi:ABC-type multidrug transport system fused ATPase/permease subunit
MDRLFEFLAIQTNFSSGSRSLEEFESLAFEDVYFKYPHTEKYVLSGVSFTMNKGDKLSIVGINGSGKSTIIKLMLGLYEIESGQIRINGYPMSDYDIQDVRKLFSALFQSFVQYPLSLRENIALSDLDRMNRDGEIENALKQSGVLEELEPKLQNGLDSFMTRKFDDVGTELSRGQWQKIALSRAYFKNAPIIIFDEPSAALDAEAEDWIFRNFESISDGKSGIMISHRISSARMSDKIIVLNGGRITEQGTHDELIALDGLYAKLYNLQNEKYTIKEEN